MLFSCFLFQHNVVAFAWDPCIIAHEIFNWQEFEESLDNKSIILQCPLNGQASLLHRLLDKILLQSCKKRQRSHQLRLLHAYELSAVLSYFRRCNNLQFKGNLYVYKKGNVFTCHAEYNGCNQRDMQFLVSIRLQAIVQHVEAGLGQKIDINDFNFFWANNFREKVKFEKDWKD